MSNRQAAAISQQQEAVRTEENEQNFLFFQSLQRSSLRISENRQSAVDLLIFAIYGSQPRWSREYFGSVGSFPPFFFPVSPMSVDAATGTSFESTAQPSAHLFTFLTVSSNQTEELRSLVEFHVNYWQTREAASERERDVLTFTPDEPPSALTFWKSVSIVLKSAQQVSVSASFNAIKDDVNKELSLKTYGELLTLQRSVDSKLELDPNSGAVDVEYWESMSYLIEYFVALLYCDSVYCFCSEILPSSKNVGVYNKFNELALLPAALRSQVRVEDLDVVTAYQNVGSAVATTTSASVGVPVYTLEEWESLTLTNRNLVLSNCYTPLPTYLTRVLLSNVNSTVLPNIRPRLPGKAFPEQPSKKVMTEAKRHRRPDAYRNAQEQALASIAELSKQTHDNTLVPWDTHLDAHRMMMIESSRDLESDEEIMDSGDLSLEQLLSSNTSTSASGKGGDSAKNTIYSAGGKILLRKPRYFNRVMTGFEWNKYNQTHYDQKNLPPKVIQGYRFNIFYPLLIPGANQDGGALDVTNEVITPTYRILKDPQSQNDETCLIVFTTNPKKDKRDTSETKHNSPYMDVCFRIVNREWEYGQRRGFKCSFERGVLSLWFKFKREAYRR